MSVVFVSEFLSTGVFLYHLIALPQGCTVLPFESEALRSFCWVGYRLLTHVLPVSLIIKCFWTVRHEDVFSGLANQVLILL